MDVEKRMKAVLNAPHSKGKTNLIKHLKGERLTQRQAIIAKCCDCMAYHIDGRINCNIPTCSLYPFMPYKKTTE